MKIALARGPGKFGGIFRRFRALAEYCESQRHDAVGLQLLAAQDGVESEPIRTITFGTRSIPADLWRATTSVEVLDSLSPLIDRVAISIASAKCDSVLAADTDLKGLIVVAASRRAGVPVTTFVASVASHDAAFEGHAATRFMPDVERYCLAESDHLIFPSRMAMEECSRSGVAMPPSTVIYNGIADEFFAASGDRDHSLVGAVMRLKAIKNPAALGRIARALNARGVRVELVADGGHARPATLRAIDGVRLVPATTDTLSLARFYRRCRAVMCPSHFEASGNVPMEALASGTPAVVTRRMGISEIFPELGLAHLVVDVDDIDASVERLLAASPMTSELRQHLQREFNWPAVCERILATCSGVETHARGALS